MSASLELLQEIKDGAKALGIAPSTLCQKAVKNGAIIKRLEGGDATVTLETAERIRAFIEANRPNSPDDGTPPTVPDDAPVERAPS